MLPKEKKKNKNKISLTLRDEELLKGLYSKPATLSQIRDRHFQNGERTSSLAAVSRRISKLRNNNFLVKTLIDGKINFSIGDIGAKYLKYRFGYDINNLKIVKEKGSIVVSEKNTNYKRVSITERDLDVFETLASGPANITTLSNHFINKNKSQCSRSFITKRLKKLSNLGYIKKVNYIIAYTSVVFYLDKLGAEELILKRNYNGDWIRMNVVRIEELWHELSITQIVRLIRREVAELNYKILFLQDDHFLRQKYSNIAGIKNIAIAIPDLLLGIETDDKKKYTFCIEVDSGKRPSWTLSQKLKHYRAKDIMIIVMNDRRRETIEREIMNTVDKEIIRRIGIGILSDVIKEGFFSTVGWKYLCDYFQNDSTSKSSQ